LIAVFGSLMACFRKSYTKSSAFFGQKGVFWVQKGPFLVRIRYANDKNGQFWYSSGTKSAFCILDII